LPQTMNLGWEMDNHGSASRTGARNTRKKDRNYFGQWQNAKFGTQSDGGEGRFFCPQRTMNLGFQLYIDGSAEWVRLRKMLFVHSWNLTRELYMHRDDLGELEPRRANLKKAQ
jgi:hypothetical protein